MARSRRERSSAAPARGPDATRGRHRRPLGAFCCGGSMAGLGRPRACGGVSRSRPHQERRAVRPRRRSRWRGRWLPSRCRRRLVRTPAGELPAFWDGLLDAGFYLEATSASSGRDRYTNAHADALDVEVAEDLDGLTEAWTWRQRYPAALALADCAFGIKEEHRARPRHGSAARTLTIRGLTAHQRRPDMAGTRADLESGRRPSAPRAFRPSGVPFAALVLRAPTTCGAGRRRAPGYRVAERGRPATTALRHCGMTTRCAPTPPGRRQWPPLVLGRYDEAKALRTESLRRCRACLRCQPSVGRPLPQRSQRRPPGDGGGMTSRRGGCRPRAADLTEAQRLGPTDGYVLTAVYRPRRPLDYGIGELRGELRGCTRAPRALGEELIGPARSSCTSRGACPRLRPTALPAWADLARPSPD